MSAPQQWRNGVPGLEGFDQAVVSRGLDVPGLDCRQVPRQARDKPRRGDRKEPGDSSPGEQNLPFFPPQR
jgi:hypothetical protein